MKVYEYRYGHYAFPPGCEKQKFVLHADVVAMVREPLRELIRQIEISNAVDDHGHSLKNLKALADAKAALALLDGDNG